MPKSIVAVLLLAISPLGYADCKTSAETWIKAFKYYPTGAGVAWGILAECKVWPADPAKTIVALVNPQETNSDDDGHRDLEVLVLDTGSGAILQRLYQKDALISDAIPLVSIQLDTARYLLVPGVLAFGVRANRHGRYDEEIQDISLYAIVEGHLERILANLAMRETVLAVNDEMNGHHCESTEISRTLAIGKTSSHGYSDLIVQESKSERGAGSAENCSNAKTRTSSRQYVLHFDGSSYALPQDLIAD